MNDADRCAEIAKRNARTFTLAATFLPRLKRRGVFALYAFCRQADDIADRALPFGADAVDDQRLRESELDLYSARLASALRGEPDDAVFRELCWSVSTFAIPPAPLFGLIEGVARDLQPPHYATWNALSEYGAAVAGTVGEMCAHVFGVEGDAAARARAMGFAQTLGIAMQLTNILRDIGEDAARGRCYLPDQDLDTFGFARADVLARRDIAHRPRWRDFMQFQIARARQLYADAEPGLRMLSRDSQQCATACARGYAEILGAIEAQSYDTFRTRAVVTTWKKATVLWRAWRLSTA